MHKTTTKEDGAMSQALEWLNAPREVLTAQQAAEQEAAWMDATLDAAGFFALEHVYPVKAAMLLCRFSPHDSTESEAESCATDCTSPDDFKRLRLTFVSIDQNRPARRSLLDWMAIAAGAGRTIHPWAHRYAKHRGLYGPPRPEAKAEPAPVQLVVNLNMMSTAVNRTAPPEPTTVEPPLNEAPTPASTPVEPPLNAAPALLVKEAPTERRARWLSMFEEEEKREKRGALQRLADSEGVDRSNMKKDIDKARAARDTQKQSGEWASQLVQGGKRLR